MLDVVFTGLFVEGNHLLHIFQCKKDVVVVLVRLKQKLNLDKSCNGQLISASVAIPGGNPMLSTTALVANVIDKGVGHVNSS